MAMMAQNKNKRKRHQLPVGSMPKQDSHRAGLPTTRTNPSFALAPTVTCGYTGCYRQGLKNARFSAVFRCWGMSPLLGTINSLPDVAKSIAKTAEFC